MHNSLIKTLTSFIFESLEVLITSLGIFILVYIFIASPHVVVGTSMEPNFLNGEFILADDLSYKIGSPQRGDVIVFQYDPTHEFIKRVIGLPGDKISLNNGNVYLNGKWLDESAYIKQAANPSLILSTGPGTFLKQGMTVTVPSNDYFVMGDNRGVSFDSRYFGFVSKSAIQGRVILIYYPFNKFEVVPKVHYTINGNTIYKNIVKLIFN